MNGHQPPALAQWLLKHFGSSPNNDAVIGDLDEKYRHDCSDFWYCRQVWVAIVTSCFNQMRGNTWPVFRAITAGWLVHWSLSVWSQPTLAQLDPRESLPGNIELLMYLTALAAVMSGTILIGWMVSFAAGQHRTTAVLGYAASFLVYGLIDKFWETLQFWRARSHISPVAFVAGRIPGIVFLLVAASIYTVLTFYGGGLLNNPAPPSTLKRANQ